MGWRLGRKKYRNDRKSVKIIRRKERVSREGMCVYGRRKKRFRRKEEGRERERLNMKETGDETECLCV